MPCWHGRVLRIADGTSLRGPASAGTDWRLHGVFDLALGRFAHLQVTDARGGEALDRGRPVPGEIRIADRGFANAQAWQRFRQDGGPAGGADVIVRMRWSSIRLTTLTGEAFDLIDWLKQAAAADEGNQGGEDKGGEDKIHTVAVQANPGKGIGGKSVGGKSVGGKSRPPIPIRLIARRKTPEAIAAAHKRLRRNASRRQHAIDPCSLIAAEWIVLATSLRAETFPAPEGLAVYRLRWQIELAFERLKSLIRIDEIRTRTEAGTRCRLHVLLVVALLSEDLCREVLDVFPSGP